MGPSEGGRPISQNFPGFIRGGEGRKTKSLPSLSCENGHQVLHLLPTKFLSPTFAEFEGGHAQGGIDSLRLSSDLA